MKAFSRVISDLFDIGSDELGGKLWISQLRLRLLGQMESCGELSLMARKRLGKLQAKH
jgi:hypothetical protein